MVVKGVGFSHDSRFLITGAVDGTYDLMPLGRPQGTIYRIMYIFIGCRNICQIVEIDGFDRISGVYFPGFEEKFIGRIVNDEYKMKKKTI